LNKHFILFSLVAGFAAQAGVVKEYTATGAPGGQGWIGNSGILSGALVDADGTAAWEMTGNNCCGYWNSTLTGAQWVEAFEKGWSLSAKARVSEGSGTGYLDLGTGFSRWDVSFGVSSGKAWVGLSVFDDYLNPALKHTLPDNDFIEFDMRYDPATKTAGLWVDGLPVLSGYTGHMMFPAALGPIWGATGFTAKTQFASVRFSITDPVVDDDDDDDIPSGVPEPSTWATMAAGASALALRGVRRR
jgi:hypothetical protein